MKKKLAAIICAAVLVLALPLSAFAADSPTKVTKNASSNGTSVTATLDKAVNDAHGGLVVEASGSIANNCQGTPVASYSVYFTDGTTTDFGNIILTFNVGAANAGKTATIYIQHESGWNEIQTATVGSDGTFSITVTELSIYSIVLSDGNGSTKDNSSTSPKTGVDFGAAAAVAGLAIAGAGVAFAARRKLSE